MARLKLKCQTICLGDIVQKAVYKLIASQLRQAVSGGNLRSNQVGENSSDEACTLPESANVLSSSWLHHHQQLSLVFWWSAKLRLTWRHHQAVSNIDSCVTLFSITASRKERRRKEPGRRHLARVWLEGTLKTLRLLLTRTLMLQMEMPVRVGFIPSRWTGWTQPTALRQCSSWKLKASWRGCRLHFGHLQPQRRKQPPPQQRKQHFFQELFSTFVVHMFWFDMEWFYEGELAPGADIYWKTILLIHRLGSVRRAS